MFRNECDLRNNCDNWPNKCEKCDGKLYWQEPVRNTFRKLFSYNGLNYDEMVNGDKEGDTAKNNINNNIDSIIKSHEKKIKDLLKKVFQLEKSDIGFHDGHHSSIGDHNYWGPSAWLFKMATKRKIEMETAEKMLDLQWERYCEMKGREVVNE
jgi:hypothetical protein